MQSTALPRFSFLMIAAVLFIVLVSATSATAQTTAFTYQGRLTDGATVATGAYQMQFGLFDSGGNQIGGTLTFDGAGGNPAAVQVNNGVFTVELDFGANPFAAGAARLLEIAVKKPADASYTPLTPRQQLTSSPYAVRTLSAGTADALSTSCVGCVSNAQIAAIDGSKVMGTVANATTATNADNLGNVAASQYVQTNDSRLSDARPASSVNFSSATLSGTLPVGGGGTGVSSSGASGNFLKSNGSVWTSTALSASDIPAGSGNYIRNTTTQQSADLNISGSAQVGVFSANTVTSNSLSNLVLAGQSSNPVGTWLRLNNTSTNGSATVGHNWNIISTGRSNGEGAGKLIFNDQTSGGTRMVLDSTGATLHGNTTVTGDLTVNGTLNWNPPVTPNCKALQTSPQSIPQSFTNIRLDATSFCSGVTFHNDADLMEIVKPGIYLVTGEILFSHNPTGVRFLSITTTATGELVSSSTNAVFGIETALNGTGLVRLNAGDAVYFQTAQGAAASLNTSVFSGRSASLSVTWVAP